jgi:hypothetical protein
MIDKLQALGKAPLIEWKLVVVAVVLLGMIWLATNIPMPPG